MAVIGIVREPAGEARVAATPATIAQLRKLGHDVVVERGAGSDASYPDEAYAAAGATLVERSQTWGSEIVLAITPPDPERIALLADGATFIALLSPALRPDLVESLAQRGITALALDAVPRISRAQSMDVLSSMANIAGYRAVVEAAHEFGRFFTGQVTAAGKVPPAKVLVAGAGVAGLAAIGAASSLGAIVRATDPRPEVADQVTSIGGEYLPVDVAVEKSSDGYAKATSEAYDRRAAEIYTEQAADVDIIITTALIPGRAAPRLITASDVAAMKPGSVIVDMAAGQGGNVEGSVAGERIVTENGVIILGYTDLASRLAAQASQLYGTNVANLVALLTPGKDGVLTIDFDDVVQRSVTVVRDGAVTWPPPPVQVAAAPAKAPVALRQAQGPEGAAPAKKGMSAGRKALLIVLGIAALFAVNAFAPAPLPQHFTVLTLSVVIGFYVIGKVHHALHTPLMSVTNAISGVIVVGAMLQITDPNPVVQVIAAIAVLLASINIFGGFAVTRRMLAMFTKGGQK
ncbi:Re/Si-specific NAD(P)(+) transhydrogenase subunit alpha [Microbacterium sp. 2MCAF23]|uniref:Re/Si-specific NAD(P)(+) transhydrogenase subunit alpha n=1 Tax=Microbacterium sp. 2MCAF23 TaxID=3232985 RepID=UPI003F9D4E2B